MICIYWWNVEIHVNKKMSSLITGKVRYFPLMTSNSGTLYAVSGGISASKSIVGSANKAPI